MVWTGDGRVFFYNPSTRTSVWERPEDLVGRTDVDKMVGNPPDSVVENAQNAPASSTGTASIGSATTPVTMATKRPDSSDDEATPAKKLKQEIQAAKGGCRHLFIVIHF